MQWSPNGQTAVSENQGWVLLSIGLAGETDPPVSVFQREGVMIAVRHCLTCCSQMGWGGVKARRSCTLWVCENGVVGSAPRLPPRATNSSSSNHASTAEMAAQICFPTGLICFTLRWFINLPHTRNAILNTTPENYTNCNPLS